MKEDQNLQEKVIFPYFVNSLSHTTLLVHMHKQRQIVFGNLEYNDLLFLSCKQLILVLKTTHSIQINKHYKLKFLSLVKIISSILIKVPF